MPKKDYYETRLKKINLLIDQKKYKEALKEVSEDIAAPYIPSEYVDQFEKLYISLSERVNVEDIEKKYNSLDKSKLLMEAYNGKTLNVSVLSFFLAKFATKLEDLDFLILEQMFSNKNIPNDLKIFALEQIKVSEIKHDFPFFNCVTNRELTINSMSDFEYENDSYYKYIEKQLNDWLAKEPSLIPLASYITKLCYEYYFGSRPPYEKEVLAKNVLGFVKSFFEQEQTPDKTFANWVNNLLSSKKLKN